MNKKNDILESWIMVEHLSEGDINLKDKAIQTFRGLQKQDYYSVLTAEIQEKRLDKYKKSGIVIYFEIFPFQEVIDFLREEYKLAPTEQELTAGNKFSFALYFDKKLVFDEKKTFVTESYYIRKKKRILLNTLNFIGLYALIDIIILRVKIQKKPIKHYICSVESIGTEVTGSLLPIDKTLYFQIVKKCNLSFTLSRKRSLSPS